MAGTPRTAQGGLTLKEVCELLELTPRQVQYLREAGIVIPEVVTEGRGSACLYTKEDVQAVYLAAVELEDLLHVAKPAVLEALRAGREEVKIGPNTYIRVEMSAIRKLISELMNSPV